MPNHNETLYEAARNLTDVEVEELRAALNRRWHDLAVSYRGEELDRRMEAVQKMWLAVTRVMDDRTAWRCEECGMWTVTTADDHYRTECAA